MPLFRCDIVGEPGAPALLEAPDRAAAVRLLVQAGRAPSRVEPAESTDRPHSTHQTPRRPRLTSSQASTLIRELATALSAGLPLVAALRTIAHSVRTTSVRDALAEIIERVEQGSPLSEALAHDTTRFSPLVLSLVRAGEASGRLSDVLEHAADLLERERALRSTIMGVLIYPAIVAAAVIIAVVIVVTFIVPRVLAAVAGQLVTLPLPTRIVQAAADFALHRWWILLLVAAAFAALIARARAHQPTRLKLDAALLSTPVVGPVIQDVAVARFARTFSTLLAAGLPVVAALRLTRGSLGNTAMQHAIERVTEEVQAGRTIADPLERARWFPPLLVQVVALGEQTGKLDEMLAHAARAFDRRTEHSIRLLTTVLPPILIVILAAVVGFVVLAILLPLIELQESIG